MLYGKYNSFSLLASGPRKDIVAASQRGRSHAQEGKPRDDHFKLHHCENSDWCIIAVADGAGSAKFSRKGSEIACETVVDYCKAQLQNCVEFEDKIRAYKNSENEEEARKQMANIIYSIIGNAAFKAHKNIKDAAASNEGSQAKDFATTLLKTKPTYREGSERSPVATTIKSAGRSIPRTGTASRAYEKIRKARTKTVIPANTTDSEKTVESEPSIIASEKSVAGTP